MNRAVAAGREHHAADARRRPIRCSCRKTDADGRDLAGLRLPSLEAPVATHMGWNLRKAGFGEGELCDNTGSMIPFAKTREERMKSGDPRLSLEERYPGPERADAMAKARAKSWSRTGCCWKRTRSPSSRRSTDANTVPTLYDKIWTTTWSTRQPDGTCLLYVDRHILDEVDSPQAFGALRLSGLPVRAPEKTLLVVDHNVPTSDRDKPNPDPESAAQIAYMAENAKLFGLEYFNERDPRQGICHVVAPEQGFTLPGTPDRVRRQPHHHPWRVRCARARHRHLARPSTCSRPRP